MKRFTRILVVLLAILTLSFCFAACGDGEENPGNESMKIPQDKYAFVAPNGTVVTIGSRHDLVIPKLGDYLSVNITDSCGGFSGKDRIYEYKSFRVYTTPSEKGEVVNMIELTSDIDPNVHTYEGLKIGSTKDEVVKTMGAGAAVGDNLSYEKGNVKLLFIIRDGTVTNIQYTGK